jgi:hypothetical protein
VTRLAAMLPWLIAGCSSGVKPSVLPPGTTTGREDDSAHLARLYTELQDDILSSYERDEPANPDTAMVDARIGTARIGAGPGDIYIAGDLARAPRRWPLEVESAMRTDVRSKHLEIQIAADQTAAWMSDELSWRIEICGRTAVVPLRITALYAHDGDRWVPVVEHLSYGFAPPPRNTPLASPIETEVSSGDLETALAGLVDRGLLRTPRDPAGLAQDAAALVLGPDIGDEWHGGQTVVARIPPGKLEARRVGLVGRSPGAPTVAYWVGTYLADVPARAGAASVRMRVSFVFEKRAFTRDGAAGDPKVCFADRARSRADGSECRWTLVQSHMSQPISDDELARDVFGGALTSSAPLALDCIGGAAATGPAGAPRPVLPPPGGQIP